MIEAQCKVHGVRVIFKATGTNIMEVFEGISDIQALFEDNECGACGSPEIRLRVRDVKKKSDNKTVQYYELYCKACSAQFSYGQLSDDKKGGLFPKKVKKREDGTRETLPDGGWSVYRSGNEENWS